MMETNKRHNRYRCRNKHHLLLSTAALLALPVFLAGCGDRRIIFTTGFAGDELFTVGDASASVAEYRVYLTNLQREYEATFGTDIWNAGAGAAADDVGSTLSGSSDAGSPNAESADSSESAASSGMQGADLSQRVKDNALARLSKVKVLNLMAANAAVSLDDDEEGKAEQAAASYFSSLNDAEKNYFALDQEAFETMYQEYALAQKEYDSIIAAVDSEISDDEARTVTCQQIRILTANYASDSEAKAKADAILQEIRDGMANLTGVTFDTYISEYNEADTSELTISRQSGDQALEDAAFSLDVGKISDVIPVSDGYAILKCTEGYNAEETELNKQTILKQRQTTAFETAYDNYIADLDYNIDEDKYQTITLVTDPQITTDTFFTTYENIFK